MAVLSSGKTVQVFKFAESGLVALCQEVAEYLSYGDHPRNFLNDCDLDSAQYTFEDNQHVISFRRL